MCFLKTETAFTLGWWKGVTSVYSPFDASKLIQLKQMGEEWSALGMQKGGLCNTSRDFRGVLKSNKSLTVQEETEAQQVCEIPGHTSG